MTLQSAHGRGFCCLDRFRAFLLERETGAFLEQKGRKFHRNFQRATSS